MTRERRSLWGSISTSKKVNSVSLKSALIYSWAIPHFDDEGYQDGEPREIKRKIVPYREDITVEDCKQAVIELNIANLWNVFHINSTVYIQDPVFETRQSFKGIKRIPSKIKVLIGNTPKSVFKSTQDGVSVHLDGRIREVKRSEEKRSEVKGSTDENPVSLAFLKTIENPSQNLDPISRKFELKKQAEQLMKQDGK